VTQPNEMPAADPGNPFLAPGPVGLTSAVVEINGQQLLMLTMRTSSGTLTGFLPSKAMADQWIKVIEDGKSKMSSLVIAHDKIGPFKIPDGHPHG
jgi:hypothetical protein